MFPSLSEYWRRPPPGYRPGATLLKVMRDLQGLHAETLEGAVTRFSSDDGDLVFDVRERVQAQFLMHLVLTEFVLQVPSTGVGPVRIELSHRGAIRRQGVTCNVRAGDARALGELLGRLESDQVLRAALMPLDFKRLVIEREGRQWRVRLEHMGASEVVNRMPGFRRYIRLVPEQRQLLLQALRAFKDVLGNH
ncbi:MULTISPECIES: DUF3156 family protein [unclassified Pseudomonas]|uniref:DUF3156 family protein n=1 Tax=unclassified Pseudomonas TaxID=196821 RepID=UPI00129D4EF6|nr:MULTISPECIES: DUF3156 family protein [unclassified Pseudomonas]MDH4655609.1 DUF3156 family protein [Pseudomonas sp. BN606]MRK19889.1 DUF3156 family protein [Pseudomonas sp. JG-B]